jgi:hypothetical protein
MKAKTAVAAEAFIDAHSPDAEQKKTSYVREWNTVDFVGKCKI